MFDGHDCGEHEPNEAVLIVGWNVDGDTPFWIVQSSHATTWGNEGFANIKMGENLCGIESLALLPKFSERPRECRPIKFHHAKH